MGIPVLRINRNKKPDLNIVWFFYNTSSFVALDADVCPIKFNTDKMNTIDTKESVHLLSKTFAAHESTVVNIESFGFGDDLGTLMIKNAKGLCAQFSWQKNISYSSKGYFKEIKNDLGATVAHHDGVIAITNGGVEQYLEVDLK